MQLVINTKGTLLRRRGQRIEIRRGDKRLQFSAKKVQSIVVATGIQLTSDLVQLAAENNIDIVFLDSRGDPTSRLWLPRMGSTAAIRRRQFEMSDISKGLEFVRGWTTSKLDNQIGFLRELRQRRQSAGHNIDAALTTIQDCRDKVNSLNGKVQEIRGSLMGLEGSAGRLYFNCLSRLMPEEYRFNGRSRQPALDPFNAMLNYAYGVLYSLVERSLILAGLDPFVGFLHTDNYNKKSLVFDMIEPFRIIAERTTVLIFTGRRAKREFFREVPGGIELAPDGRAYLISELNRRLDRSVRYPVGPLCQKPLAEVTDDKASVVSEATTPLSQSEYPGEADPPPKQNRKPRFRKLKQRVVIQYEAHAVANTLLGRNDIPRISETEELWAETGST